MPVFTQVAAALVATTSLTGVAATVATSIVAAGLAAGTGHLLGVFDEPELPVLGDVPFSDPGVDQRLQANTSNRPPVLFGSWMTRGIVTYHEITNDRQTSYTVITLGHHTDAMGTINRVFWNDIELTLGPDGEVTAGRDVEGSDANNVVGNVNVQLYPAGGRSTYLEGLSTAWTENHTMTGLAYAVVTVRYNRDKEVTGLPDMRFIGTSSVSNPAQATLNLLQSSTYGLGLASSFIDLDSFTTASNYFNELVDYTDRNGMTQQARRFEVNGALGTNESIRERIEVILEGSNSSLRWSDGRFGIFSNRADTVHSFTFDTSNIVGDINVTETGFNNLINEIEIHYGRNELNNWTRNTVTVTTPIANRLPNEPERKRRFDLPLVITDIEAERLGFILLNQSREQLTISHSANAEAMPVEAGDVVRYTLANYGWDEKLFRITRVVEREEDGVLSYDIEAIEYTADVYADRMFIERDAAPNSNLPKVDQIPAVNDLAIVNVNTDDSVPSFGLQWTIPNNALIQVYDIYLNRNAGAFTAADTIFLESVRPAQGGANFINGVSFATTISGLQAATYNLWVVGRNDFATSAESNTANINWQPEVQSEGLQEIIRLNENLITNDPGPPTNSTGTDRGWYDPNTPFGRQMNRDPHWEARTLVRATGGENRILDYTVTGTSGVQTSTSTPTNQQIRFDVSGTPGQAITTPAQPEITEFTLSGTAADYAANAIGRQETWQIDATGSSDPTRSSTAEEFYIYLSGTSGTGGATSNIGTFDVRSGGGGQDGLFIFTSNTAMSILPSSTTVRQQIWEFVRNDSLPTTGTITTSTVQNSIIFTINGFTLTFNTGDIFSYNRGNGEFTFQEGTSTGTAPTLGGTVDVIISSPNISTVNISIPTESINETFSLTGGLTTSTTLRDDLLSSLQGNATITGEFTVTSSTASGLTGITDGEPIVLLTANDNLDHTLTVTFTNGNGDLSTSRFGSVLQGGEASVQSQIRIAYDSTLMPSTQDIMLGNAPTSADLARNLAASINMHGSLTAVQGTATTNEGYDSSGVVYTATNTFGLSQGSVYSAREVNGNESIPTNFNSWSTLRLFTNNTTITSTGTPPANGSTVQIRVDMTGGGAAIFSATLDNTSLNSPSINIINFSNLSLISILDTSSFNSQSTIARVRISAADGRLFITAADATVTITEDGTSSSVVVTATRENLTEPTISITTRGTSDSLGFTINTIADGIAPDPTAGVPTRYSVTYGGISVIGATDLPSGATSDVAAANISNAINALASHLSVVSGSVITSTSSMNVDTDLVVSISAGTNRNTITTGNNLSVARVVTQEGDATGETTGVDASIRIFNGTTVLGTFNVGGQTTEQIATTIGNTINSNAQWNAISSGSSATATALFTGETPTVTVTVTNGRIGSENDSLVIDRVVLDSGTRVDTTGTLSTYSITLGGVPSGSGDIPSGSTAEQAAMTITTAVNNAITEYGASRNGAVIRATSTFFGSDPDLVLSVTQGTSGTLAISRAIIQAGQASATNLTGATWEYYIINREVRVDDDTTTMNPTTGIISVNRGLVLDNSTISGAGNGTVLSSDTHTTGASPATLVFFGGASLLGQFISNAGGTTSAALVRIEYSTDSQATWQTLFDSNSYGFATSIAGIVNDAATPTLTLAGMMNAIPSTTYHFRAMVRVSGTNTTNITNNVGFTFLIAEELRSS